MLRAIQTRVARLLNARALDRRRQSNPEGRTALICDGIIDALREVRRIRDERNPMRRYRRIVARRYWWVFAIVSAMWVAWMLMGLFGPDIYSSDTISGPKRNLIIFETVLNALFGFVSVWGACIAISVGLLRRTDSLHCVRCWYEVRSGNGAMPSACPECGADLARPDAALPVHPRVTHRRHWIATIIGLVCGAGVAWLSIRRHL